MLLKRPPPESSASICTDAIKTNGRNQSFFEVDEKNVRL